jgi:hypothetical protein
MTRWLYRCLLLLHPVSFREQYAGEMLWIFDAAGGAGAGEFFADGVASLLRQWLFRTGLWKAAAGGAGAFLLIGGMLSLAAFPGRHAYVPDPPEPDLPVLASSGLPAEFNGHWSGNILFPGPAGQIEFTLFENGGVRSGEVKVRGLDGVAHPGVAEDIRAGGGALSFRFKTNRGEMIYRGRMIQGKLRGYVRAADGQAF